MTLEPFPDLVFPTSDPLFSTVQSYRRGRLEPILFSIVHPTVKEGLSIFVPMYRLPSIDAACANKWLAIHISAACLPKDIPF
jgi:hypothetical protein